MVKKVMCLLMCFFSVSSFASACGQAISTDDPGFCASFKPIAECYCMSNGLPRPACTNMKSLYDRMMVIYGSLQNACAAQHYTSTETCINDWNCYRFGGVNSYGALCSGSGKACE